MHQLAISLKKKGYEVTGSDDEIFEPARSNLHEEGLLPAVFGWDNNKIVPGIDAVILGMHARQDNPELLKAIELGLKIYSFPEYIYNESREKIRVAIGGSHGKTSTTAMIMHVLQKLNRAFDYMVGARLEGFEQSVNITDAPVIICEADEYPASILEKRPKFHFLFPQVAVLTGIAWDHINVFPTFDFYLEQFRIFIGMIEKNGLLIYNKTDKVLDDLIEKTLRADIKYAPYTLPDFSISEGKTEIKLDGDSAVISVFGEHNLLNLNAAYLVCKELGVSASEFLNSIKDFKGAAKRLELLSSNDNFNVYRDFAHAPSKVTASINAVKQQFPSRKLIAVLELHTYSSLNESFLHQYEGAMEPADEAAVFYSSHALELKRMPSLPPETVVDNFKKKGLKVFNEREQLENWLKEHTFSNANLLLMSSGSFDNMDVTNVIQQ